MFPKFQFYSSDYNFIDTPDLINFNTDEVKYDSDWWGIPSQGKLLQYTQFKETEGKKSRLLEDDLVEVTYKGESFEVVVENPIEMTPHQFEMLSHATKLKVIRNINISENFEES